MMDSYVYGIGIAAALCLVLTMGAAQARPLSGSYTNGFINLTLKGGGITCLQVDPSGRGRYHMSFIKDLRPEFWEETESTRIKTTANAIVITPLEIWETRTTSPQSGTDSPDKLEPGHTLAQTFDIPSGETLASISIRMPTWHSTTSAATLSFYCDGKLIASRKLTNIRDNSWQTLELTKPVNGSKCTIQLSDPIGDVGWWSGAADSNPNGGGLADGQLIKADRSFQVNTKKRIGTGSLNITPTGKTLEVSAEYRLTAESAYATFPWRWKTTWTKDGYDCTPKSGAVFSRFYSDNQRYMPIQQLKRRSNGGRAFDGCKWIEMDGTRDADLRLSADKLSMHWEMQPQEMSLRFDTPIERSGDTLKTRWTLNLEPRDDTVPAEFPHFACSDKALETDLNRFLWDRNFSFPSPASGAAAWFEWMAISRAWVGGPTSDGEVRAISTVPITPEGYVHTWGATVGWPLVHNRDTRHFDTNARYILACWRHFMWSGDANFLKGQSERLHRAMRYQLEVLHGNDGLIITPEVKTGRHEDLSDNYWDILPFGHLDAYANIVFYGSIEAMGQIDQALGEKPLTDYSALRARSHKRYDEVFWDDKAGRYIGCVDSDGNKHDYGFTFINLEALYYGLGDKAKAARIYHWMETEPTSSGKADTYSKWIFAPRSTTIHNPMWGRNADKEKSDGSVKPWWTYWWAGTAFGDQCQDGGAILYTSFFDLMSRARHLGADNAWARFMQIMNRYRMPDRLCGGSPLYRGEGSQQENAGSIGVDTPFPESGLVPCYFLYGVIGVEPTPAGLRITPNLPKSLTYAEVKSVSWRGMSLRIRVTRTTVTVDGTDRGKKPFRRIFKIKPGGSALIKP